MPTTPATQEAAPAAAESATPAVVRRPFPFLMGADPEFTAVSSSQRISAVSLLRALMAGRITEGNMGYDIPGHGNVGWDGNSDTGEIRPKPENTPEALAAHVGALYAEISKQAPIIGLTTKNEFAPIGGHVHFGIATGRDRTQVDEIHKRIMAFIPPVLMGEDPLNARIRMASSYGDINSYNFGRTYELRVPSAEWQISPKIATATLAFLGVVMAEILENRENVDKYKILAIKSSRQADTVQQLSTVGLGHAATQGLLTTIKKAVRTFKYYPDYKKEVEYILNPARVLADKKKVDFDIVKGWKLSGTKKPKLSALMNDAKVMEMTEAGGNPEKLMPLVGITWNEELRVSDFANTIRERAIAGGIGLKNRYFFFGMRKGVNAVIAMDMDSYFRYGADNIKTLSDNRIAKELLTRMVSRMNRDGKTPRECIAIAIPYEARMKRDVRPLAKAIVAIEAEDPKAKRHAIKLEDLRNDDASPHEEKGVFYKAYNQAPAETPPVQAKGGVRADEVAAAQRNLTTAIGNIATQEMYPERTPVSDENSPF